jgi:hypothetical protein
MKRYFEMYDADKTYIFPNGALASPETLAAQYAVLNFAPCVIETDISHVKLFAIHLFEELKDQHNIDASLSDEEAITELENILSINSSAPIDPTPEERIAAALEFQNVSALSEIGRAHV